MAGMRCLDTKTCVFHLVKRGVVNWFMAKVGAEGELEEKRVSSFSMFMPYASDPENEQHARQRP